MDFRLAKFLTAIRLKDECTVRHLINTHAKDIFSDGTTLLSGAAYFGMTEQIPPLLAAGADINRFFDHRTPLFLAIQNGHTETAITLIQHGCDINLGENLTAMSPLHIAAELNDFVTVKSLITANANVNAKMVGGWTPLFYAAYANAKTIAEFLLAKGADINAKSKHDNTALSIAHSMNHLELAAMLTAAGAEADLSQEWLNKQFCAYLVMMQQQHPDEYKLQDVRMKLNVIPEGMCNGYSLLWLASPQENHKQSYFRNLTEVSLWNRKSLPDSALFETLLSNLLCLQYGFNLFYSASKGDYSEILKCLFGDEWKPAFNFGCVLTDDELIDFLKLLAAEETKETKETEKLNCEVMSLQHATGLQINTHLLAYDSNRANGEAELSITDYPNQIEQYLGLQKQVIGFALKAYDRLGNHNLDSLHDKVREFVKHIITQKQATQTLNTIDSHHLNALGNAIKANDDETALALIDAGIQLQSQNETMNPPLLIAAQEGNVIIAAKLIEKGANVNIRYLSRTALYLAAESNHLEMVKLLLSHGAEADFPSMEGCTPLMAAALKGNVEMMQILIAAGARVNMHSFNSGFTPLYNAAYNGRTDAVKFLLQQGADLNFPLYQPLAVAIQNGHLATIRAFAEYGVDFTNKCTPEATPLQLARLYNQQEIAHYIELMLLRKSQLSFFPATPAQQANSAHLCSATTKIARTSS